METEQTFLQSLKQVVAPLAVIMVPVLLVGGFAADAYITKVVQDEIALSAGTSAAPQVATNSNRLTVVEGDVENIDGEVKTLDQRFHDFVQKIIDKL